MSKKPVMMYEDLPLRVKKEVAKDFGHLTPEAGWYPRDSIWANECYPILRPPGGGVTERSLMDLPQAFDECINHVKQRIQDAQKHLRNLEEARDALRVHIQYPPT